MVKFYSKSLFALLILAGLSEGTEFYVSPDGSGSACTQENPCGLETALDMARANREEDTIYLKGGTYELIGPLNVIIVDNKPLTIRAEDFSDPPVLDGDIDNDDATNDRFRILKMSTTSPDAGVTINIEGIRFQKGYDRSMEGGGALHISTTSGSVNIKRCEFIDNKAERKGGGLYMRTSFGNFTLYKNTFKENTAENERGGSLLVEMLGGKIKIKGNIFKDSESGMEGGAISLYMNNSSAQLINNIISNNASSSSNGGGVYVELFTGSTLFVTNNTVWGNFANGSSATGGGFNIRIMDNTSAVHLHNNIVRNNSSTLDGRDIYIDSDGDGDTLGAMVFLKNNILGNNAKFDPTNDDDTDNNRLVSQDIVITRTDYYYFDANLTDDPQLQNPSDGNFHLKPSSPAIDAGDNLAPHLPPEDMDGDKRILGSAVDIGADEFGYRLSVNIEGEGKVTSTPEGIDCGSDCSETFSRGESVVLKAESGEGYTFKGWDGDCSVCGDSTECSITMDSDKLCKATFEEKEEETSSQRRRGCNTGTGPLVLLLSLIPLLRRLLA